jgi:hypothetical protein
MAVVPFMNVPNPPYHARTGREIKRAPASARSAAAR